MWDVGRDVTTEPGLPSLWNIFRAFPTEQRICPITGMITKLIVRFRIFLRLNGSSINHLFLRSPYL